MHSQQQHHKRPVKRKSANSEASEAGLITAKGKGTCYIYAYAQNGICKRTKVLVR